jgi:hypothetical protein
MMQETYKYLESYLSDLVKENGHIEVKLPLYHTCSFTEARDYIRDKKLFPKHCTLFREKIIYLFWGRAEYRDYKAPELSYFRPVGFVFNAKIIPESIRIYPFDTGAVDEDIYSEVLLKTDFSDVKDNFVVGKNFQNAYSLIRIIYGTLENYIKQTPLDESKIIYDEKVKPEMERITKIHTKSYKKPDLRKATIEVQVFDDIEFSIDSVLNIWAPGVVLSQYRDLIALLNELNLDPVIRPDNDPIFSCNRPIQEYYSDIRNASINLSLLKCKE